jgi:hypothetical protein
MTQEKDAQIAKYLADHRHEYGGFERLNAPAVWRFDVALLPHNDIFDNEFWATINAKHIKTVTIAEQEDGVWDMG